jgi:hypothetical protein
MKKMILLFLLATAACKKSDSGNNAAAILGSWRYTGNDSLIGENLGDTLRFVKPDTVYYTFQGSVTWSNFHVDGSRLMLIGSAASDTLVIRRLDATQLQLIITDPLLKDTAAFQKFTP